MRRSHSRLVVAVIALAAAATAAIVWQRDALATVVAACRFSQHALDAPFPCLDVVHGTPGRPGYALLRTPRYPSEVLLVATDDVAGIESPILQSPAGAAYWQAAWDARRFVDTALGRDLPRTAVGLAVNSYPGRSQDRLHIHIDCLDPDVNADLAGYADHIGPTWSYLPFQLEHRNFWVRKIIGNDLTADNPTATLPAALAPVDETDRRNITVAVIGARFADGSEGFYVFADKAAPENGVDGTAEALLDHYCPGR